MTNQMKKCTIILCIVFLILVCLIGNVITGIFLYLYGLKQEDNESVAETIVSMFDTSSDYSYGFNNNTEELEVLLAALEEEATDIIDSFAPNTVDIGNEVCYIIFIRV